MFLALSEHTHTQTTDIARPSGDCPARQGTTDVLKTTKAMTNHTKPNMSNSTVARRKYITQRRVLKRKETDQFAL